MPNVSASYRQLDQAATKLADERPPERFPELEYFGQMHGTIYLHKVKLVYILLINMQHRSGLSMSITAKKLVT